jgi:hypothetical protein
MLDEMLSRLGNDELFVLMTVAMSAATAVVVVLTVQWRKVRQAEIDASLKRDMLSRGLSAEDILDVLAASNGATRRAERREAANDFHVHAQQFANQIRDNVKQALNKVAARL